MVTYLKVQQKAKEDQKRRRNVAFEKFSRQYKIPIRLSVIAVATAAILFSANIISSFCKKEIYSGKFSDYHVTVKDIPKYSFFSDLPNDRKYSFNGLDQNKDSDNDLKVEIYDHASDGIINKDGEMGDFDSIFISEGSMDNRYSKDSVSFYDRELSENGTNIIMYHENPLVALDARSKFYTYQAVINQLEDQISKEQEKQNSFYSSITNLFDL